ncbi:hypothetical protein D3C78_372380 [compost metagenome]
MLAPIAIGDLVADQGVTGALVGDAQQGLGQAHQCHPFLRRQRELLQQALYQPLTAAGAFLVTQLLGDAVSQLVRRFRHLCRLARLLQQHWYGVRFGAAVGCGDGSAQHRLRKDAFGEVEKYLQGALIQVFCLFFACNSGQARLPSGRHAAFDLLQVVENGLFDHPVRRLGYLLCSLFESLAGGVVKLYAKCGGCHVVITG